VHVPSLAVPGTRLVHALALAVLLVVAGCSDGDGDGADVTVAPRVTATSVPAAIFPLTGRRAPDTESTSRPALSTRMTNVDVGLLPYGLDSADIVFEDLVSQDETGFFAVFHSADAGRIGPMAAAQEDDPFLLSLFGGLYAHAGGDEPVIRAIRELPITDVGPSHAPEAYRAGDGPPIATGTALRERTPPDAVPPPPLFFFRGDADPVTASGAEAVERMTVLTTRTLSPSFAWDGANTRWLLTDGEEPRVINTRPQSVDNVVIMRAAYATGAPELVGAGDLVVGTGGRLVLGRWERPRPGARVRWLDAAGEDIRLRTGRTWVLIAPGFSEIETEPEGLVPSPAPSTSTSTSTP
jgi:hypothetical protein